MLKRKTSYSQTRSQKGGRGWAHSFVRIYFFETNWGSMRNYFFKFSMLNFSFKFYFVNLFMGGGTP